MYRKNEPNSSPPQPKGRKYFFVCFSLCLFRLRVGNTRNKGIFLLCWSGESQFLIVPPAASLPESPFLLSHLVIKEVTLEKRRGLYMKASFFTHWSVLNRTPRALTWTQQHLNMFLLFRFQANYQRVPRAPFGSPGSKPWKRQNCVLSFKLIFFLVCAAAEGDENDHK